MGRKKSDPKQRLLTSYLKQKDNSPPKVANKTSPGKRKAKPSSPKKLLLNNNITKAKLSPQHSKKEIRQSELSRRAKPSSPNKLSLNNNISKAKLSPQHIKKDNHQSELSRRAKPSSPKNLSLNNISKAKVSPQHSKNENQQSDLPRRAKPSIENLSAKLKTVVDGSPKSLSNGSPVKTPSKRHGRPKPQSKANAKLRSSPTSEENECEIDTIINDQPTKQSNNNNNEEKSPEVITLANNNNNNNENDILGKKDLAVVSKAKENDKNLQILIPERSAAQNKVITSPSSGKSPSKPGEGANPNEVKCKVCKQWYPNRYFQRKHMLMEHEDQLYECRVCSFNSVDPEKLKSHIIKLHVTKKEKSETTYLDSLQEELEKLIDKKVPRKVMMEDGVTLGRDVNTKMRYVCALCNRIYTSKYSLERHVRCHTLEKPYQCDVCDFTSSYREHMMRHMTSVHLIVHSNAPKVKYVAKKKIPEESKAVLEEEEDELDNDVDDPLCAELSGSSSQGSGSPNAKKRRNILRQRFECAVCGLRSTHKTDLVEHIKTKHPNAHIESLANKDGSKVHLIVTMAKKPRPSKKLTIQCSYCFLIFHDTWKYKVHLRSHTGVKPFQCSVCDMKATSKMTIRDHIHRKHPNVTDAKILLRTLSIDGRVEEVELAVPWREFKCEYCNEQFNDNYNLKIHKQKNHPEELPFFCLVCSHKEKTKAAMVIHCHTMHKDSSIDTIVMRNGKPCKIGPISLPTCDFCKKVFAYRSQLNLHLKVHTGERSFNCDHCDYKTNFKKFLANHVHKVHFGKAEERKPKKKTTLTCEQCDFKTKSKAYLENHIKKKHVAKERKMKKKRIPKDMKRMRKEARHSQKKKGENSPIKEKK